MFDILKKKITGLVGDITKKIVGEKEEKPVLEESQKEIEEKTIEKATEKEQAIKEEKIEKSEEKIIKEPTEAPKETEQPRETVISEAEERKEEVKQEIEYEAKKAKEEKTEKRELEITKQKEEIEKLESQIIDKPILQIPKENERIEVKEEKKERIEEIKPVQEKQIEKSPSKPKVEIEEKVKVKTSFLTKVKSFIVPEVTIKEEDISSALEDFELQLLTADVALPVCEEIISDIRKRLVGKSVKSNEIEKYITDSIYQSIADVIEQENIDLIQEIKNSKKPYKILFIGPNGAGKTTTIAKVAHYLKKNGFSCVISASDTFRAAAIEQTIEHAKRLGIPYIKHDYGSDPAAVAFDAVKYAEAHKIDVVLIDSAGRQETNRNLIEQLKKIERVTQPNRKVFVGEGITGNALLSQVSEFNNAVKLDGVILTKLDVDAKGGTVISVKKATGVPILFVGMGQEYDDLIPFDKEYIIKRIMS